MKARIFFSAILLATVLFTGCGNDETPVINEDPREELLLSGGGVGITEEVKPMSRAVFPTGKTMKVIVRDNNSSFTDQSTTATTGSNDGIKNTLTCGPKLYWDDLGGKSANLKLMGIYTETSPLPTLVNDKITWEITDNQFTYPTAKELMFAQVGSYKYTDKATPAHLQFKHVLTKITLKVNVNTQFNEATLGAANVIFKDIPLKADYDITNNACTIDNNGKKDVTPSKDDSNKVQYYLYTILCAPHLYTQNSILATIGIKGNTYNVKLDKNDLNFAAGNHTTITINIQGSEVTATASLTDWNLISGPSLDTGIITFKDFLIKDINGNPLTNGSTIHMAFTDKANIPKVHSAEFTYNASTQKWTATKPVYWDDIDTAITKTEALLTIKATPTTGEHYFQGSLTKEFAKAIMDNSNIDLDDGGNFFIHPLSKVDITIKTSTGDNKINMGNIANGGSVVIKGKVNYIVGTTAITQDTSNSDKTVTGSTDSGTNTNTHKCITAYIWPQSLKNLCEVTVDGNTYTAQINTDGSNYTFEAGKHYTFTVNVTKTGVSMTASLKDWETVTIPEIGTEL